MKSTILIIAHNEEKYIDECLQSIVNQSKKPEEIILVAHNCTDLTVQIAGKYQKVKVLEYNGPDGAVFSRDYGINNSNGDIIVCTDGDTVVSYNWFESLYASLEFNEKIAGVGSVVYVKNNFLMNFFNLKYFYFDRIFGFLYKPIKNFYFFGASFAFRKKDYLKIGGLKKLIEERAVIGLESWPDDAWLSLKLQSLGDVVFVGDGFVVTYAKEKSLKENVSRLFRNMRDSKRLSKYFKSAN